MKKKSYIGWILFSMVFIAIGAAMAYAAISGTIKWIAMKSWVEVPATIIETALLEKTKPVEDSKGRNTGRTSTSYKVTARYTYFYNNESYTGDRVSMHTGYDNVDSFHQDTYEELSGYKDSGREFRCYINPSNPSESILYRNPRWVKIFFYSIIALVFGLFGCGSLLYFRFIDVNQHQEVNYKSLYPEEPWRWKKQWNEGYIVSGSKITMLFVVIFAFIWNLGMAPALFLLPGELSKGNKLGLIALIFPIAGAGLAIWAIRCILRWIKFGESVFDMETIPGVIGGPLGGKIHTKVNIEPEDGFHLTLSCINRVRTRHGKKSETKEYVLWQNEQVIKREMYPYDSSRSVIPVLFHVPYDSEETNEENPRDSIIWRLEANASVPGVDYKDCFIVPVFRTKESSKDFVLDKRALSKYEARQNPREILTESGIDIERLSTGEILFSFPMARNKAAGFFMSFVMLVFTGVVYLIFRYVPLWMFKIVFGFVYIAFFYSLLDIWFFHSEVEISGGSLYISKGLLFFKFEREIGFSEIGKFNIKNHRQVLGKKYFCLYVTTKDGKNHLIGKGLKSYKTGEILAGVIKKIIVKEQKGEAEQRRQSGTDG